MTSQMKQTAAWIVLVLAVAVFAIGRNRNVDITMIVIVLFCMVVIGADAGNRVLRKRRQAANEREERTAPWTMYSRPARGQPGKWEIGIERRVGQSRLVLDSQAPDRTVEEWDSTEIIIAEEAAKTKATEWTDRKVRM